MNFLSVGKKAAKSPAVFRVFSIILAAAVWWLVWEAVAFAIGSDLVVATPRAAFSRLFFLAQTADFWRSIFTSFSRIFRGFLLAAVVGVALACVCAASRVANILIRPG